MKRIVNGNFADPTSTRSVVEISSEQFEAIKGAISHLKRKYNILIEMSDGDLGQAMSVYRKSEVIIAPIDKFASDLDETVAEVRAVVNLDYKIITILEARIILLALSSKTDEMVDLSGEEFRVLIEAVRQHCLDLTNVVNSSREELLAQIKIANEFTGMLSDEKVLEGIDRLAAEEYKEKSYKQSRILFGILEAINQPYEGAQYLDKNGNKIEPNPVNRKTSTNRKIV